MVDSRTIRVRVRVREGEPFVIICECKVAGELKKSHDRTAHIKHLVRRTLVPSSFFHQISGVTNSCTYT
jgi:hypothetical protein